MHRLKQSFKHIGSLVCNESDAWCTQGCPATVMQPCADQRPTDQNPPRTESASTASLFTRSKNAVDCPRNSRSSVNALMVATAPPFSVEVGLITEHSGRFLLMNVQGSAKIRFV